MSRPAVVLLHGGWGGGWEWRAVANVLARHGFEVYRPSLTGLGDRRHLACRDIGLQSHVDDVLVLLEAEQLRDVVLVGQSYSGMVISSVAARCDTVRSLVYVDGFVPDDGECLLDLIPRPVADGLRRLAVEGDGWRVPVPFATSDDDPPEVQAYAARANVAMPLRCFTDPAAITAVADRPTSYVRCTQIAGVDMMKESVSRARTRCWPVIELDGPHDAHYFAPDAVAAIITDSIS